MLHNLPAGDWAKGERGIACLPDRVGEFQDGVGRPSSTRPRSAASRSTASPASRRRTWPPAKVRETFVANLRFAAPKLAGAGIKLADRADQHARHPGLLPEPAPQQAIDVIAAVGSRQPVAAVRHLSHADHGGRSRADDREASSADRAHAARRQPGPQRARHGRDQLPVPLRHSSTASATTAGSAASTSRRRRPTAGLGWIKPYLGRERAAINRTSKESAAMSKVGFIGLGIMGAPMAGHLQAGGHTLFVLDVGSDPGRARRRRARKVCQSGKEVAEKSRDHHHDGAGHAGRRGGAVRRRRRRRGPVAGQDRRRHELDLADRDQGVREAHQRARLRLPRCAGLGRRGRRQGGVAHHHGRRQRGGVREGQAAVRAHGQEHHAGRRQRRRPDLQGRQPDHRRADDRSGRRGAAVRVEGRRRPGRCARR